MMQDVQNIPPPDVNSTERDEDFGNHSDIKQDSDNENDEPIPVSPDQQPSAPIKEPPDADKTPIGEENDSPKQIA